METLENIFGGIFYAGLIISSFLWLVSLIINSWWTKNLKKLDFWKNLSIYLSFPTGLYVIMELINSSDVRAGGKTLSGWGEVQSYYVSVLAIVLFVYAIIGISVYKEKDIDKVEKELNRGRDKDNYGDEAE